MTDAPTDQAIRDFIGEDHERRMAAARARAGWELGSGAWAHIIIGAYLNPDSDTKALDQDRDHYRNG